VLILLWQLRGLWRLGPRRAPPPPRAALVREILFDTAWVVFALFWLPRMAGITWPAMFRGSPDLAWWLVLTLMLSVVAVGARARLLMRS